MINEEDIIGCFISITNALPSENQKIKDTLIEQGDEFRSYIFGENGIRNFLKKLKYNDYGTDLKLILLQFYVNPIPYMLQNLKSIETYRKKEKSIGIPIIIDQSFFSLKLVSEKIDFLKSVILYKISNDLHNTVKLKKIDIDFSLFKHDLEELLNSYKIN